MGVAARHGRVARTRDSLSGHRIYGTSVASVYPLYVAKVERKGRTKAELDEVLTTERDIFNPAQPEAYWRDYQNPEYRQALHDVDVYRVAYRTTIPEQGNRPTVAYGLVAIPQGATGSIPLVSYQHGTLFLKESAPSQAFSWDKNSNAVVKFGVAFRTTGGSAGTVKVAGATIPAPTTNGQFNYLGLAG